MYECNSDRKYQMDFTKIDKMEERIQCVRLMAESNEAFDFFFFFFDSYRIKTLFLRPSLQLS